MAVMEGFLYQDDFISESEEIELIENIDKNEWIYEQSRGIDKINRRNQQYGFR